MNREIFEKLKELYELIKKSNIPNDDCIILGEESIETNIIGNENAYLRLISSFAELLLCSKQLIPQSDEYENDEDGFWTSEIKQYLNEYSDFNIVASVLQTDEHFAETVKETFDKFQSRRGYSNGIKMI